MIKAVRSFLYFTCFMQAIIAVGIFLQWPILVDAWPFEGTTALTFIFLSSILAAAAASTLWATATKTFGALAGIGLDYIAILTPLAVLSFQLGAGSGTPGFALVGVICILGAIFGFWLLLWSIRVPIDSTLRMPGPVRWSFIIFILALLIVSVQLILKVPNVIPWKITPELSVVMGWMFVGAAIYFVYGLLRPSWLNAAGQLAGFLAYDIVLIVPFLKRLSSTPLEQKTGMIVYTAVVIYSGLLAIYYLFIHKQTRLGTRINQPAA